MNRTRRYFRTDPTGLEGAANRLAWATVALILLALLWIF